MEITSQKVDFRSFEMINKIMHINGVCIVFKGINRHEFNARTGSAITKEDMLWGAPVHSEYLIDSSRDIHFEFIMRKYIHE